MEEDEHGTDQPAMSCSDSNTSPSNVSNLSTPSPVTSPSPSPTPGSAYTQNGDRLTMAQILKGKEGFECFANHLVREFSVENLFFLFEAMQIKTECIHNNLFYRHDAGFYMEFDPGQLSKIRRPDLVIRHSDDLQRNIKYMIDHYLSDRAEFALNIGAATKNKILKQYRDWEGLDEFKLIREVPIHINTPSVGVLPQEFPSTDLVLDGKRSGEYKFVRDYALLFDDALREIERLIMVDSFQRFCRTEEYSNLSRRISNKTNNVKRQVMTQLHSFSSLRMISRESRESRQSHESHD